MKIAFWSSVRGCAGVTTNLACISSLISICGIGKSVVLENHYSARGIGDLLLSADKLDSLHEHGEYYSRYGIEYILKRLYSGEKAEKLIHQSAIPLVFSSMLYLPQGRIVNKDVFNYEFSLVYEQLFDSLESISEYVFIDTETNQNLSSNLILSEADLVVVNLDQNPVHIREFFQNHSSIQQKAVYLIGNYCSESKWNIGKICKEFHIPKWKVGVIPQNIELEYAMKTGHLLQFLNRNYFKPSDYENENLIRYARRASQMIRRNIVDIRRDNRKDSKMKSKGEIE